MMIHLVRSTDQPALPSLRSRLLAWFCVGLATAASMTAACIVGLFFWDGGFDVKTTQLLAHVAAGSFIGIMMLGIVARRMLPRRPFLRVVCSLIYVVAAILGGISGLVTIGRLNPLEVWEATHSVGFVVVDLTGTIAVTVFLFLAMAARLILPHGLIAMLPVALWIARRRHSATIGVEPGGQA